jgi:hypothetical protein
MRRSRKGAGVIVALVLLVPLLVPAFAGAAEDSYGGTYEGYGKGTDENGKSASSNVTFWVEDQGEEVRITMRVARLGVTLSTSGAEQLDGDTVTVPIDVSMPGADVSGTVTLEPDGDNWILTGSGSGKLFSYEGSGEVAAIRTATGVVVPGVGDQLSDVVSAIFSGPPDSGPVPKIKESGGELQPPDPPATVEQVAESTTLSPAEKMPPIPEQDKWSATIAVVALTFLIFGFFVFV